MWHPQNTLLQLQINVFSCLIIIISIKLGFMTTRIRALGRHKNILRAWSPCCGWFSIDLYVPGPTCDADFCCGGSVMMFYNAGSSQECLRWCQSVKIFSNITTIYSHTWHRGPTFFYVPFKTIIQNGCINQPASSYYLGPGGPVLDSLKKINWIFHLVANGEN